MGEKGAPNKGNEGKEEPASALFSRIIQTAAEPGSNEIVNYLSIHISISGNQNSFAIRNWATRASLDAFSCPHSRVLGLLTTETESSWRNCARNEESERESESRRVKL